MRPIALVVLLLAALFPRGPVKWDFETVMVGAFPDKWEQIPTKEGERVWKIVIDKTAPDGKKVLAHVPTEGKQNEATFVCLKDYDQDYLGIEVAIKRPGGKSQGGAGLVWHLRDSKNYRIADWNPANRKLSVYSVQNDARRLIQSTDLKSPEAGSDDWHRLRVSVGGQHLSNFSCTLDGKELLLVETKDDKDTDTDDDNQQQANAIARLGIWADADVDVLFDGFVLDGGEHFKRVRTRNTE